MNEESDQTITYEEITTTLTLRQELFCKHFASDAEFFGNGVKSYMAAYPDATYASARTCASAFLTNPNILARINELLEDGTLNDAFVDKQLAFLITQNSEFSPKMQAIKEYNALKKRIVQRLEVDINPDEESLESIVKDLTDDRNNLPDNSPRVEAEPTDENTPSS